MSLISGRGDAMVTHFMTMGSFGIFESFMLYTCAYTFNCERGESFGPNRDSGDFAYSSMHTAHVPVRTYVQGNLSKCFGGARVSFPP
jgi:hypothetical protein